MNPLAKGIEDYLALRRGLGFKLVRHETVLKEFASFLARKRDLTLQSRWLWSGRPSTRISDRPNGRRDFAFCVVSPGTGALRIH
jgi:hypothetical protein